MEYGIWNVRKMAYLAYGMAWDDGPAMAAVIDSGVEWLTGLVHGPATLPLDSTLPLPNLFQIPIQVPPEVPLVRTHVLA